MTECLQCGQGWTPEDDPSPCEGHNVCDRCAPCLDCTLDAAEQAAMDERRGL